MIVSTDQTGRIVRSPTFPQRIISLVPSQTELLFELGLETCIAGITKFCVHPETAHRSLTKVGGTKKIHIDTIRRLAPDLIIANKEENTREDIELLDKDYPVWISDVNDFASALSMIHAIGLITGTESKAAELTYEIISGFKALEESIEHFEIRKKKLNTAYLIWQNPFMTAGRDTFIHAMIEKCGLINAFEDQVRYPVTSLEEIMARRCDLLLLSSEPFPFSDKHKSGFEKSLHGVKIICVDGEMFSWYGSRMKLAPSYFNSLLRQISG